MESRLLCPGQSRTSECVLRSVMRPWIQGTVSEDSIDHWARSGGGELFVSVFICVRPIPRAQGSIQVRVRVKVSRMAIGSLHSASSK